MTFSGPVIVAVCPLEDELLLPNRRVCCVLKKTHESSWRRFDQIPNMKQDREVVEKILGKKKKVCFLRFQGR